MIDAAFNDDPVIAELRALAAEVPPQRVSDTFAADVLRKTNPRSHMRTRMMVAAATLLLVVAASLAATTRGHHPRFTVIEPGGSMAPTIDTGEAVVFDKRLEPRRGDVVLARLQNGDASFDTPRRVIGAGGDTVECPATDHGRCTAILVNGRVLEEPYVASKAIAPFGPVVVAADSFFVLGDNRNNAVDSRMVGAITRGSILGIAVEIVSTAGDRRPVPGSDRRAEDEPGLIDPPLPVPTAPAADMS